MANNKEVALKFFELFGKYDPAVMDLLTEDVQWKVGTEKTGMCPLAGSKDYKAIEESLDGFGVIMPDGISFDILNVIAEGDLVAVEAASHAKLINGNKHRDIYENAYFFLFKMKDGKIQHITEYCDTYYATLLFT